MSSNDALLERWLLEELENDEDLPDDECSDVENVIEPERVSEVSCESDSEIEGDEDQGLANNMQSVPSPALPEDEWDSSDDDMPLSNLQRRRRKKNYFGKNRFRWSSAPPSLRSRTLLHNILQEGEGIKSAFRSEINSSSTPLDIWKHFFTDEMLDKIVMNTNAKIQQIRPNYQKKSCVQDLDLIELKAFIGLLFYTAVFKDNREHYRTWYSTDGTGREIYRCIMSKNRFEILLKTFRFDDAETRDARRENDASAPISELFQSFVERCQAVYCIGSSACIDEMLLAFRGRCRFKMYMPKKPAKYGIKILCLTDARSGYLLNAYIYLGKNSDGLNLPAEYQQLKKPTQAVLRLISIIEGSNRNVTTDNWFTSIELINLLKQKQLTLVGTLRKNQREIPPEFLPARHRSVESSIFGFTKDITISSYVPKPNKAVITVSSMHHTPKIIEEAAKKPEIILFYNQTKIGVDLLDQRCSNYSTGRRTRRWPMAVFYRLLDVSASNSYVVSKSVLPNSTENRGKFMKKLAQQLVKPHLERRENNLSLQRGLRTTIRDILHHDADPSFAAPATAGSVEERLEVRKNCSTCDYKKKRRTQYICFECKRPICLECTNKLCIDCREKL